MASEAAHTSYWQTSEVVFGIPFLVSLLLEWRIPISLPRGLAEPALIFGGAALILAGITFIILARREFGRLGQPTDPLRPTGELVTRGVFSLSRNPIYLGAFWLLAGIALAVNLPWELMLLLPSLIACHYVLIAPEERYLAAIFGEDYTADTAAVHRWIGRRHISSSKEGA